MTQPNTAGLSRELPAHSKTQSKAPVASQNVGEMDRWLSAAGAGALLALAVRQKSPLAGLLAVAGGYLAYRGASGHCYVYDAAGINTSSGGATHTPSANVVVKNGVRVEKAVTINKPAMELFTFWRDFENLPKFMKHLKTVKIFDDKTSHWVARAPAGAKVEWDAVIINEIPGKLIAWKSTEEAGVNNTGSVHFDPAPEGRGTEVRVVLQYDPPAGRLGRTIARLLGEEPTAQVAEDLLRFKQLMEAGEIPTTDGQSHG